MSKIRKIISFIMIIVLLIPINCFAENNVNDDMKKRIDYTLANLDRMMFLSTISITGSMLGDIPKYRDSDSVFNKYLDPVLTGVFALSYVVLRKGIKSGVIKRFEQGKQVNIGEVWHSNKTGFSTTPHRFFNYMMGGMCCYTGIEQIEESNTKNKYTTRDRTIMNAGGTISIISGILLIVNGLTIKSSPVNVNVSLKISPDYNGIMYTKAF